MEISKRDWMLYREKIADWQENYMDHLNKKYIALLSQGGKTMEQRYIMVQDYITDIQEQMIHLKNALALDKNILNGIAD